MGAKQKWRVIEDGITEPQMHFAVEEALLRLTDENYSLPTLRIRNVEPSVWIGYYQQADEDVDLDYCRQKNLKVIRRLNSGGAVYQDYGTFCYTAFFNKNDFFNRHSITETDELYSLFGKIIIELCNKMGVEANLSPVNDITVGGRKIYGSAQLDWYSAFAHSGSILINVDKDNMQNALKPSNLKFIDKGFKTVKERVVNLSEVLNIPLEVDYVIDLFQNTFSQVLNVEFAEDRLSARELELANELYEQKYSQYDWTYNKTSQNTIVVSDKIASGVIVLKCNLKGRVIQEIAIQGDLLIPNHKALNQLINDVKGKSVDESFNLTGRYNLPIDVTQGIELLLKQVKKNL